MKWKKEMTIYFLFVFVYHQPLLLNMCGEYWSGLLVFCSVFGGTWVVDPVCHTRWSQVFEKCEAIALAYINSPSTAMGPKTHLYHALNPIPLSRRLTKKKEIAVAFLGEEKQYSKLSE